MLTLSDIPSLPSKYHFKAEMFPKRFLLPPTQLSKISLTEITSWTNQWLRKMPNRDKYELDGKKGKYLPLEKMYINLAFNQLSKGQLRYWLKNLFEQWNWNGVKFENKKFICIFPDRLYLFVFDKTLFIVDNTVYAPFNLCVLV